MAFIYKSGAFLVLFCLGFFIAHAKDSSGNENKLSDIQSESFVETSTEAAVLWKRASKPFALPGQTPEICPHPRHQCGFQLYDRDTRQPALDFIVYCKCPEGSSCVKEGDHMSQAFYYYRCKQNLDEGDEAIPSSFFTTKSYIPDENFEVAPGIRIKRETVDSFYAVIEALATTESLNEQRDKAVPSTTPLPTSEPNIGTAHEEKWSSTKNFGSTGVKQEKDHLLPEASIFSTTETSLNEQTEYDILVQSRVHSSTEASSSDKSKLLEDDTLAERDVSSPDSSINNLDRQAEDLVTVSAFGGSTQDGSHGKDSVPGSAPSSSAGHSDGDNLESNDLQIPKLVNPAPVGDSSKEFLTSAHRDEL